MMPHQRPLRRLFKQVFGSVIKRQEPDRQEELFDELMRQLHKIESRLEILAQTIARQAGRGRQA